jgi:hypothetical protein
VDGSEVASASLGRQVRFGRHLYIGGIPRRVIPDEIMTQVNLVGKILETFTNRC